MRGAKESINSILIIILFILKTELPIFNSTFLNKFNKMLPKSNQFFFHSGDLI